MNIFIYVDFFLSLILFCLSTFWPNFHEKLHGREILNSFFFSSHVQCDSWTENWRTDAFKLWYWRRLLRVPWTARRSNQSILKEINLEYSWEKPLLKLKLYFFGHLMRRANSLEKSAGAGKDWRQEEKRTALEDITDSMDMNLSKLQETVKYRVGWHSACSPWGWKELDMT